MTQQNSSRFGTAFTETIEAREGVTTGISAADRAHTIRTAIAPGTTYTDLARPGHVFPLRARQGGVLVRAGQTEASVDLARLAGLNPSGVICEIMRDDGEMARIPDLIPFCRRTWPAHPHRRRADPLPAAQRALHRSRRREPHPDQLRRVPHDRLRERSERRRKPHRAGPRRSVPGLPRLHTQARPTFPVDATRQAAPLPAPTPSLVRVHTRCTAGDIFAADCHCREILDHSMRMIAEEGCGVILYLHNTSRGFEIDQRPGLAGCLRTGRSGVPAGAR